MGFTLSNANGQARYLHKIHKMSKRLYEESGGNLGSEHFLVTVALLKLLFPLHDALRSWQLGERALSGDSGTVEIGKEVERCGGNSAYEWVCERMYRHVYRYSHGKQKKLSASTSDHILGCSECHCLPSVLHLTI